MTQYQFDKLIEHIYTAIANASAGSDGLVEYLGKINTRQSLHDSFFSNKEEEDLLYLKKLQVLDQKKIIKEHVLFFNRLLDPDDLGWAVTEEVRNEARVFLGIPEVIIKKK
jgi:hypothetical protein